MKTIDSSVGCSKCGAAPGSPCVLPSGEVRRLPHLSGGRRRDMSEEEEDRARAIDALRRGMSCRDPEVEVAAAKSMLALLDT